MNFITNIIVSLFADHYGGSVARVLALYVQGDRFKSKPGVEQDFKTGSSNCQALDM